MVKSTGLPIEIAILRAIGVLILIIVMCCISDVVVVNKLRVVDTADIFQPKKSINICSNY